MFIIASALTIAGCVWGGLYYYKNMRSPEIFEYDPDKGDKLKEPKKGNETGLSEEDQKEEILKRESALRLFLEYPCFRLPVLIVPVIRDGRVHAFLFLRIAMKATGRTAFKKSKILLPRLVDGIYTDLYKAFGNLWNSRQDPATSVIKERIFAVTEKILGKNHIETIYLRDMFFTRTAQ